jgi:NADPH2:quinone reductase
MTSDLMRAAHYPTDGPDQGTLSLAELPTPEPGPGEVLVRVRFSGVNPTDWKSRQTGGRTGGQEPAEPFIVPNQDGAGEIEAVGTGVAPARVGERVWLWEGQWQRAQGTAAQWIALPCEQAVALPPQISLELGAGLGIPAITAHRCLFADGPLDGAHVLVHGGAGAVGHAAIELARWQGAHVATTVSSPLNLPANLPADRDVLTDGGVITSYTAPERPVELTRSLMVLNARLAFVFVYTIPREAKLAAVADISRALREDALTALPEIRFGLEVIAAAHEAVEHGAVGKVLVELP